MTAIAASDIPRERAILVFDMPAVDDDWVDSFVDMGFLVTPFLADLGPVPEDRYERRVRHDAMRELTMSLVSDGPVLLVDDDSIVPPDVYSRLYAIGPHSTGVQVSRWGNTLCGVYRDGSALTTGSGVEPVEYCGHYCLLTTGEMYRETARHTRDQCYTQPIPGLFADWDCRIGHLTREGVLWPT